MIRSLALALFACCFLVAPGLARPVEVTVFEGGEGADFYAQVAEQYERLRPGVSVSLEVDPSIADKLRIRVLEGSFPEVTNANLDIWALMAHDQIQPLDEWLDGPSWDGRTTWRETFLPGSLDQFSYQGKTYGVPLVYVVWSIYYDKALFRRNGWKVPSTWPEFFELCQEMSERGVSPLAFQGRYPFYAKAMVQHTYFQLAGRSAYDAQQALNPGSYDNPAMRESLGILQRVSEEYLAPGALGMSHTEAQLQFFQGRAAMLMCGSWLFSEMRDNIPPGFELGSFPLPLPVSSHADPHSSYATSGYWFVFKNSPDPAGGADFLRYLTSPDVAGEFAGQQGMAVAVVGANAKLHPMMGDVASQLQSVRQSFGVSPGQAIPGVDQVWTDILGQLLAGRIDAAQAALLMEQGARAARRVHEHPEKVEVRHLGRTLVFLALLGVALLLGVRQNSSPRASGGCFRRRDLMVFLLPALTIYTLFFMLPSLAALAVSGFQWDGLGSPSWVGLRHFQRLLLESDLFWSALANNLFLMSVIPAIVLPLSLILAYALHQGVWGSRLFRVALFFPNLLGVAGILLWQQLYNPQGGIINSVLVGLGFQQFEGFPWLAPEHLYTALVPMGVWGACGFNMVLFLAAMQGVPNDLYEAADLYGARSWQKLRFITLPMIWETVVAALLFMLIGGMKAFEAIWLLTNQSPTSDNHVVGTLMIRSMFVEQRVGQAAAIACLLFVTVLAGSLISSRLLSRAS